MTPIERAIRDAGKCNECDEMWNLSAQIRDLIWDDATDILLGAMVGSPAECLGFALEWIKRQKGLDYDKKWFKKE